MKRLFASAGLLVAVAGMIVTAGTPAVAAVNGRTAISAANRHSQVTPAAIGNFTFYELVGGVEHLVSVTCIHNYNLTLTGTEDITSANNGCTVRVYFHQYVNYGGGHGWAYCISPGKVVSVPEQYRNPKNIEITSLSSAC